MALDWSRVGNTTISNYFRTVEDAVTRRRVLLAMLKEKGRIIFNASGQNMVWRIRYKEPPIQGLLNGETITIAQRDLWKTASLDYRGFVTSDAINKIEMLKNSGDEAIINVFKTMATTLGANMQRSFAEQLYIDGNATGNESLIHGINSFMSVSGAATAGYVGVNNDSYASLSTALGNYGGAWSADTWPYSGTGDSMYDFFTPTVVDYTDTAWIAATKTWPNTCLEALRFGIMAAQKNESPAGLGVIVLDQAMYRDFKNKLQSEENLFVQRGQTDSALYKLGFRDTVNYDGVDLTWEYGVPAGEGYGWAFELMELLSMQPKMFATKGPDASTYRMEDQSYRVTVDFVGNLKFGNEEGGIRNFVKFKSIT